MIKYYIFLCITGLHISIYPMDQLIENKSSNSILQGTRSLYGLRLNLYPESADTQRPPSSDTTVSYQNLLINKPKQLLKKINKERASITQECADAKNPTFEELINVLKKNPLIAFNDCTEAQCTLNRLKNPLLRNTFENRISSLLKRHNPDKKNDIVITSFASGGLFSELRLISLLIKSGYEHIHLNIIDPRFAHYLRYAQKNISYPFVLKNADADEKNDLDSVIRDCNFCTYKFYSLLAWFNAQLSAHVSLSVYDDVYAYIQESALYNTKADCIIANDYVEEKYQDKTIPGYIALVTFCLKTKGIAASLINDLSSHHNFIMVIAQKKSEHALIEQQLCSDIVKPLSFLIFANQRNMFDVAESTTLTENESQEEIYSTFTDPKSSLSLPAFTIIEHWHMENLRRYYALIKSRAWRDALITAYKRLFV